MEYLKNKRIYDWKMSKNRLLTSFWHHPWQKAPAGCVGNGSTVYYRRIIWKPRKVTRNRNFPGLLRHHDIKKRAVTSFIFGLDEWHQIGFILGGRGSTESFQPWHEFLLLIGVQMGVCPHDNRNSIPDPLGHQNNRVPKFDTERNVAVPLRYNNDKQKKPLFSRGLSVCRLLFNSFSKLKIDENYKEKRRLFY